MTGEVSWPEFDRGQRQRYLAGNLVAAAMTTSAVAGAVELAGRLAPGWDGDYLVWAGLLAAILALHGNHVAHARHLRWLDAGWWKRRFAEWVLIAIAARVLLYAVRGTDPSVSGQTDWAALAAGVFSNEYGFVLVVLGLAWAVATSFGAYLIGLGTRADEVALKRESGRDSRRMRARRGLVGQALVLGGLLVLARVTVQTDPGAALDLGPIGQSSTVNLIVYFTLTILLLALSNLAVLRARWFLDSVPVDLGVASRWLSSGLLLLAVAGLMALLLPRGYSYHLLDLLRALGSLLGAAFGGFTDGFYAVIRAIAAFFETLLALVGLGGGEGGVEFQPSHPLPSGDPADQPREPARWRDLFDLILFWALFLGVIALVVHQYASESGRVPAWLRPKGLGRRIAGLMRAILARLKGLNRRIAETVEAGIRRLRPARGGAAAGKARPGFISLRKLGPRERVIFYYLALLRRAAGAGRAREPDETPERYRAALGAALPDLDPGALARLTTSFTEARYSRHTIDDARARGAREAWARLRAGLRRSRG